MLLTLLCSCYLLFLLFTHVDVVAVVVVVYFQIMTWLDQQGFPFLSGSIGSRLSEVDGMILEQEEFVSKVNVSIDIHAVHTAHTVHAVHTYKQYTQYTHTNSTHSIHIQTVYVLH